MAAIGLPPSGALDEQWLEYQIAAVNSFIIRNRPDLDPSAEAVWPGDVLSGGADLAARWYRRRGGQPASFDEFGNLPPQDRDIEIRLQIGRYAKPVIV